MKLQKLAYLCQGWCLAFTGAPMTNASFEAWTYGPVIPEVYRAFKECGSSNITTLMSSRSQLPPIPENLGAVIDEVWKTYKNQAGTQLSTLTHQPGSAWDLARRDASAWHSPTIPLESIRQEFLRRQQNGGNV